MQTKCFRKRFNFQNLFRDNGFYFCQLGPYTKCHIICTKIKRFNIFLKVNKKKVKGNKQKITGQSNAIICLFFIMCCN